VHVGGDFACDASGRERGNLPLKRGSIFQAVAMPRSSCIHRALPPSGPPDGVRRCSLEGSASGSPPPAISPPDSSRSWWRCRSCLLLAAVRGAQPRGGWCSSAIARLQGFSSCSPAATSRQWSSRGMTTSLVVEISEPGCGLPSALSFKDVHHPRWGGGRAELGPAFRMGWRPASSSSIQGRKVFANLAKEANFGYAGSAGCRRRQPPHARCLGLGGFGAAFDTASCCLVGAWLFVHRTGDGRAMRRSATAPGGRTRRRTPRGRRPRSWMVLSSLRRRTGARTSSRVLR
jgi:hypothetical protein